MEIDPGTPPLKTSPPRFLFIRTNSKYVKLCYGDIFYFEALNKYVRVVTRKTTYLLTATMHDVEQLLPADLFCRIHRSYIISLENTDEFNNEVLHIANRELPIGKQYKLVLHSRIITIQAEVNKLSKPVSGSATMVRETG